MKHKVVSFISFTIIIVFLILNIYSPKNEYIFIIFIVFGIYIGILSLGVFNIKCNYFFKSISKIESNKIYLTFDDGPDPNVTPKLLEVLRNENCKSTFFLIGKNAEMFPELVKQIHFEGHSIGNHTYSHSNFIAIFSTKKLIDELKKTNDIIEKIIGEKINLFRVPVGISNPRYAKVIKHLKMLSISWSFRTYDTKHKNEKLENRLNKKINNGDIILFHDTIYENIAIIENFIKKQKENGKIFANLKELKKI